MKTSNRKRLLFLLMTVVTMFLGLSVYLVYFQLFRAEALDHHSANKRNRVDESVVERGSIFDRHGTLLAKAVKTEAGWDRESLFPINYAHLIGYHSDQYGKSGLEQSYDDFLLNNRESDIFGKILKVVSDTTKGNHLKLTIDQSLQSYVSEQLAKHRGAIVVLNAKSGEVLAMASRPSFNSQKVDDNWLKIIEDESAPLLNRATQGLYVPGSVMKIISAVAIIESGVDQDYTDTGSEVVDGYEFKNYQSKAFGAVNLEKALNRSVNTYFANKALAVGGDKFQEVAERFYLGKVIPFDVKSSLSKISFAGGMPETELAAGAFGQGKTLVTPLHMALAAAAIANEGQMMKPYLVQEITSAAGQLLRTTTPGKLSQVTDAITAEQVKAALISTAKLNKSAVSGAVVGGKTGTAQNETDKVHAWYAGFIEKGQETYAIAIVLEQEGQVAQDVAVPMAKKIFQQVIK